MSLKFLLQGSAFDRYASKSALYQFAILMQLHCSRRCIHEKFLVTLLATPKRAKELVLDVALEIFHVSVHRLYRLQRLQS